MGLSAWEQNALDSIKDGLASSDPVLVARLTIFTRLASGEEMPASEKIQVGSRVSPQGRTARPGAPAPGLASDNAAAAVAGHYRGADRGRAGLQPRRQRTHLHGILGNVLRHCGSRTQVGPGPFPEQPMGPSGPSSRQGGYHGDDGDQGDEHVQQVSIQAPRLEALGGRPGTPVPSSRVKTRPVSVQSRPRARLSAACRARQALSAWTTGTGSGTTRVPASLWARRRYRSRGRRRCPGRGRLRPR